MKRLKLLIVLFCLTVSLPLAYVILRTYDGLDREERATLHFFSETLFDKMEEELARLVQREEGRSVDEYHYSHAQDPTAVAPSPLNQPPEETYILGYLQNNPDGSFQTPLVADLARRERQQDHAADGHHNADHVQREIKAPVGISEQARRWVGLRGRFGRVAWPA